jgi:hypothetical protein
MRKATKASPAPAPSAPASSFHSTVRNVSGYAHDAIAKTEKSVLAAGETATDALESVKNGFATAQAFGGDLSAAVGLAARKSTDGVTDAGRSMFAYGQEVVSDTMDVGRKTMGVTSLHEAITLHTDFAERRIQAAFAFMADLNKISHEHTVASWKPLATLARNGVNR